MKSHKINQKKNLIFPYHRFSFLLSLINPFDSNSDPRKLSSIAEQLIKLLFPHDPLATKCFHCKRLITTNCRPKTGLLTVLASFSLSSVCCLFGCCFLPFVFSEFKGEKLTVGLKTSRKKLNRFLISKFSANGS